jgi:hypothetical protein
MAVDMIVVHFRVAHNIAQLQICAVQVGHVGVGPESRPVSQEVRGVVLEHPDGAPTSGGVQGEVIHRVRPVVPETVVVAAAAHFVQRRIARALAEA